MNPAGAGIGGRGAKTEIRQKHVNPAGAGIGGTQEASDLTGYKRTPQVRGLAVKDKIMPEHAGFDLMGILISQFEKIDLSEGRGLRGKPRRWFRALAPRRWAMTAVFIRCICGREHRVCSPKTCRCGAELSYRCSEGMITPYATIQADTIEEWIAQGHPVESHKPELLSFDWKLVRPVNWPMVLRRRGK